MNRSTTYELIKNWIMEAGILPGTRLVEQAVAKTLGLSRAPVREGLLRLLHEGLLVRTNAQGLAIRTYTEQSLVDLFTYREYLDGMATRLFTLRAEDSEIMFLKMLYDGMHGLLKNYDHKIQREKDYEFHMTLSRGARNERILNSHRYVLQECFYVTSVFISKQDKVLGTENPPKHLDQIMEEHRSILDAVSSRNPDEAETVARESVRNGLKRAMFALIQLGG